MQPGYFTREFLSALPSDNSEALLALANEFRRLYPGSGADYNLRFHDDFIEALAIISALCRARGIPFQPPAPSSNRMETMRIIGSFILEQKKVWEAEVAQRSSSVFLSQKEDLYLGLFASEAPYDFSPRDLERAQQLASDLRGLISASNLITEKHKRRLLRRLDATQQELHANTSDIDRFWGFLGEVGIVARKFGADLDPIVDRAFELARIVLTAIFSREGVKALPEVADLLVGGPVERD